ncbi:hypothetical protein [Terricaulis sp.]|uniref:hypothetical protein n=1 Tax=Terricaulis sp. TaxID=2768686 RepID=UPI0037836E8B
MATNGAQKQRNEELAAVDAVAGRMHEDWRRDLLKTNPEQRGQPRMRMRGGVMVDVNQPWAKLHPKAQADNVRAAGDAYKAVKKFPRDREAAAALVHDFWIKRNKADASQPKELFKPYAKLPEIEKDKDRAHVDAMTKAIASVRKRVMTPRKTKTAKKSAPKAKKANGAAAVKIDAQAWKRLQASAKRLSAALGREVPAEVLLAAGADAMAAVAKALAAKSRARR